MELSGRTEFLSLFDVAQVLCVNEASGLLRVEDENEKGYLYFDGGKIINALDADRAEGEDAAKRVFAMRDARYSFSAELPSVARRISSTTQSLMLDIARQLDEESEGNGDGEHVREALQATRALHELFHRLDSESRTLSHRSSQGFAVADLFAAIRDTAGAALWLRTGAPPEVHAEGRRIPLSEVALDRAGFESLRDHLVRSASGIEGLDGESDRIIRVGEGEAYRVQRVRAANTEIVTVRRVVTLGAPTFSEDMLGRLGRPGTVTVYAAADPWILEEMAVSLAAGLAAHAFSPILAFARRWPSELRSGSAPALFLDEGSFDTGPNVIDRLAPRAILVADCDVSGGLPLALRAARRGAVAIVGVCGPAEGAPARLLDAIDVSERMSVARELDWRLSGTLVMNGESLDLLPTDGAARASLRAAAGAPHRAATA